ncbi:MAG: DNA gyrase subunit A [Acidobacteria bacterium]|uniref:DNA gyrase subunit A n=1 Tax=Candidatus Polarisedimenticola svalbardensis TaxID=2886004 RepID=A0A8J7CD88_9BACT|nr:DNA gyrase subunit A [Candidatus Polarisedimenticola svalbardensis]
MDELSRQIPISIEEEMKRSYLDYAMSVIVGRALPDVRDGLKPVHRRVLYAMYDTSNTHDKPYKKSARTVGSVIGRFHPHGDTAVYDTIVRLAQDFSMRYPMVDGQGNFGSVDGDRAAAMRYTEIRLQKLAAEMLRDIEKETVEFLENYDGSEHEPAVLPAAIPNLLVNGSDGIAVGMATKIPPHNLGEVIDAINLLIENPEAGLAEILELLPGPDFPTAGYIYGRAGIHQAYATGRGRVIMRGKAEIEPWPGKKDRERVIIRELPYQVNKAQLVKDIAGLVKDKKVEGISDIRDESDRDGIRVVIEVKRGENANILLNQLYKFTKLQSTFGINSLAIVNGRPETLPVRDMLRHFIDFRKEVVVRRTMFDLRKAEDRAHILEGLKIAIDNLDEVIKRIRESKTPAEAKASLRSRFEFSDRQAQAILEMRLHRLTGLERQKIIDEYEEIIKLITSLKEILASDALQYKIIVDELAEIREKFADPRRTEIVDSEEEISLEDLIKEEDMVITVTRTGYIKRTALSEYRAQKRGGKGRKGMTPRAEDLVDTLFVASTHDYILVFTSAGKMHWLKVYRIPEVGADGKGKALVNLIQIGQGETVAAILAVRDFEDDRFVVLSTRRGFIKKTALSAFSNPRAAGIIAINIEEGDEVLSAGMSDGNSEIFIATASGKSIRFKESDVRPMGRTTRGVIAIRCAKTDRLVAMEILSGKPDILTISSGGYGKRTDHQEYRTQGRGGSGILNMRTTEKIGEVVASMEVNETDHVMIVTAKGKIIRMDVAGVSRIGRATQGVRMIQLNEGDAVVSATRTSEHEEEENGE